MGEAKFKVNKGTTFLSFFSHSVSDFLAINYPTRKQRKTTLPLLRSLS